MCGPFPIPGGFLTPSSGSPTSVCGTSTGASLIGNALPAIVAMAFAFKQELKQPTTENPADSNQQEKSRTMLRLLCGMWIFLGGLSL